MTTEERIAFRTRVDEARRKFNDASRGFQLRLDKGLSTARAEQAMDTWAEELKQLQGRAA